MNSALKTRLCNKKALHLTNTGSKCDLVLLKSISRQQTIIWQTTCNNCPRACPQQQKKDLGFQQETAVQVTFHLPTR